MTRFTARAAHSAVVVAVLGIVGSPSSAAAQRARIATAQSAQPERRSSWPLPGVSVSIDARRPAERRRTVQSRDNRRPAPRIVYVPVLVDYGYQSSHAYRGGVYDPNGRPLSEAYGGQGSGGDSSFPIYVPDLTGSPYVAAEGGAMVVDFGDGLRRSFTSCAALAADATPDGQARTIFYRPPADGLFLRAGQTGRVRGTPPPGANACYAADAYGRTELRY